MRRHEDHLNRKSRGRRDAMWWARITQEQEARQPDPDPRQPPYPDPRQPDPDPRQPDPDPRQPDPNPRHPDPDPRHDLVSRLLSMKIAPTESRQQHG